jgi:hypothetical protein
MNPRLKLTRSQLMRLMDGFPVQVSTEVGLLELETTDDPVWQPMQQVAISAEARRLYEATMAEHPVEVWTNGEYEALIRRRDDGATHMSIKRLDRAPIRNWRIFQQIKNELLGEDVEAVELFPSEARLVDNANQYHLFGFPEGVRLPLGFPGGMVIRDPDDVDEYNRIAGKGRQEKYQPGITVGEGMYAAATEEGTTDAALEALRKGILDKIATGR